MFKLSRKKYIDVVRSNPPPIFPSNPFYFLIEFIDQQKSEKYELPTEKIDFTMGTMSKEISAMDRIIINPKNSNTISYLFRKWSNNIYLVDQFFKDIDQQSQKDEYARRIYFYYWNFLVSIQKWRETGLTESTRAQLGKFEDMLTMSVQELDISPEVPISNYDVRTKQYTINVPYAGNYKLAVYNYKPNDRQALSGFVNNTPHILAKSSSSNKWYFGESIRLDQGGQSIVLPELIRKEKSYPGFKINATARSSECKSINLGEVDPEIDYNLNLEYLTLSDRLVDIELLETNQQFPKGNKKTIYPQTDKNSSAPFSYRLNIKYKPSIYAETALLRICVEGTYDFPAAFELKGIKVTENYSDYLAFVTKRKSINSARKLQLTICSA